MNGRYLKLLYPQLGQFGGRRRIKTTTTNSRPE